MRWLRPFTHGPKLAGNLFGRSRSECPAAMLRVRFNADTAEVRLLLWSSATLEEILSQVCGAWCGHRALGPAIGLVVCGKLRCS